MSDYYRYEVQGNGDFPWDMLRYDRVWPLTEPSPSRYVVDGFKSYRWAEPRIVEVQGYGCTAARWASFGWYVQDNVDWRVQSQREALQGGQR
jgi:hypothetical protein